MCTLGKKFTHTEVYEIIQSTVAYIQKDKPIWILKHKDSKNKFYFNMDFKLDLAKFEIKIIKYENISVKLKSLIDQAIIKGLIVYADWNFLPYLLNTFQSDTDFLTFS